MNINLRVAFILLINGVLNSHAEFVNYVRESDIPEFQYLDKSVNPCDNFYEFTCGNFKNVQPMPDEENVYNWDHFSILQKEIHEIALNILDSDRRPTDPVAVQKAKAYYQACVDVDYVDDLSLPQLNVFQQLGHWPAITIDSNIAKLTWIELGDIISEYGVPFFFNFQVTPSSSNASLNVIYITRDPLKLPEAAIYEKLNEEIDYLSLPKHLKAKRETEVLPFQTFITKVAYKMRDLLGTFKSHVDIDREIEDTMRYMRVIQNNGVLPPNISITALSNTVTLKGLQEWTNLNFGDDYELNWVDFLNRVFKKSGVEITEDMVVVLGVAPDVTMYGLINTFRISSGTQLMNFIMSRLLTYMAPDSDSYMRNVATEFYKESGFTTYARKDYCVRSVLGYPGKIDLALAVTHEYQNYYFNVNKISLAYEMITDLQAAFLEILEESNWMDSNSSEKAIQKANNMITLLAFPEYAAHEELLDDYYRNLRVCSWDHFGNSQRLRAFRQAVDFAQIGLPKNRELWTLSPLEVNAFYNRASNRILFPVSMLNPVFFTGNISALDYGRIGAVIGHEITHAFDNQGKNYNEEGVIKFPNWWSTATQEGFDSRASCFSDQYSTYYIDEIKQYVNGPQTLNENIADNGGLRSAQLAFKKLRNRKSPTTTVEGYTVDQLFYIGYGTMWCMTETDYYLERMRNESTYAPGRYRVNGPVSNMVEFSESFNCPIGSNMNPKEKCILW